LRVLRFAILAGGVLFLAFSGTLRVSWEQQFFLGLLLLIAAFWMDRASRSHLVTLTLVLLSVYSTFRYAFWRISTAIAFFRDPGSAWTPLDALFIGLLLLAECYAFMVLALGYLQVLWPLRRSPVPLPDDPKDWPAVDLLIPTLDEPLSVVRFTALAAMNIDWPADRLNVYILDDGKREEFRTFAAEAGIGYIARDDNTNAKAGNINHALAQLSSPFVAVFDCDHVPTRSFLQLTMGWLLRDQKLAMLQTPHHFYSPDPFERNLDQFRIIPSEDELFYGVVQDGNDFWNATCFCGSCAVLRRSALDQVGGVAVETVTEDAHTSLRMQMRGWNTAYINIPQAAGLATESLSAHVRQRVRWARGMVQILRIENPLFARGLKPAQRLCYFNAMVHFLFALPRLIFLTAPLIYLVFGMTSIPGFWAAIIAYAVPHLALSSLASSRIQGDHRHTFWNEIYETVLAPYILLPTLFAFLRPRSGTFNVTAKGGAVSPGYFDARIARPFLLLLLFNLIGLFCAVARLVQLPTFAVPPMLSFLNWPAHLYSPDHAGIVCVNAVWLLFNLTLLGVATAVAWESQQRRQAVRVTMSVPSDVILPDGSMIQGITADLSSGGVRTRLDHLVKVAVGDPVKFVFPLLDGAATLPATIVRMDGNELRAHFNPLTLQEDEALTMLLYSRADAWLGKTATRKPGHPFSGFARIVRLSLRGLWMTIGRPRGARQSSKNLAGTIAPILLFAAFIGLADRTAGAAQQAGAPAVTANPVAPVAVPTRLPSTTKAPPQTPAGNFDTVFTLADASTQGAIVLSGSDAIRTLSFSVPRNQMVKSATMSLRYSFSPGLLPTVSQLNISLNGTLFATLPVAASPSPDGLLRTTLTLPADLLVYKNQLTFQFVGHYAAQCEDPANSTLWSHIDAGSTIELQGSQVPLANDLSVLPLPFYDSGVNPHPAVPIVFLSQPSPKALQAAGILASWFGILNSKYRVIFPVSIGAIPSGNAIILAENASQIPQSLGVPSLSGATVAMRVNPSDPTSSVLLVAGADSDQLLTAATALVLHGDTWNGSQVPIQSLTLPSARNPNDAPRWLSTDKDKAANIGQILSNSDPAADLSGELQGNGSTPVHLTLRLPPDLDFGDRANLAFHLLYRYNGVPLAGGSTLQVYVNGAFVSSTPMPHSDNASSVLETVVPIPVSDLHPFSNSMEFRFMFQPAGAGHCANVAPPNLEGAILKDSYLDISGIPHSAVLPNLQLFSNAGYPFTRKADLADTSIVLPNQPSSSELEMFLAIMGHFGAQTGYPALNVSVTNAAGMTPGSRKDYLVLGTVDDQSALRMLNPLLPIAIDPNGLHIRDTKGFFDRGGFGRAVDSSRPGSGQLVTGGSLPDALIEGIEWPAGSRHTVVAIVLRDESAIPTFLSTFLDTSQTSAVSQSVSVLHGTQFSSYSLGGSVYRLGEDSSLDRFSRTLRQFPWLIAVLTVTFCFLMAVLAQAMLRRHARARLQGTK
jgi:cellulose synthase (UDP-forming)